MVYQSVLAHEWGLVLGAEIANKSFAMRVLDVLFQFCFGLATDITLLALMRAASLTVDVSPCSQTLRRIYHTSLRWPVGLSD